MNTKRRRRMVRLAAPGGAILKLEVFVVQLLAGGTGIEITQEQDDRIRSLEAANGGAAAITAEEYAALLDADEARVVELAGRPTSALHHLFNWDKRERAHRHA
jgi:hypothetical protein